MGIATTLAGNVILFALIFCMSATVESEHFAIQVKNTRAIWTCLALQFVALPFLGFLVVKILDLQQTLGIALLIVTSSPSGSYSNWWCSLFNADLALSVTMTAISTIIAIGMLPLNILLYTHLAYGGDFVSSDLGWAGLGISLTVVLTAIVSGILCSQRLSTAKSRMIANRCGTLMAIALIIFSIVAPEGGPTKIEGRPWSFYVGVPLPIVLAVAVSTLISIMTKLKKPELVTVGVECCYQNTGVAITACLNIFQGDEQKEALGVPLYYTAMQAVILGIYCLIAWKAGWTYAPHDDAFCKVLFHSYDTRNQEDGENSEDRLEKTSQKELKDDATPPNMDVEDFEHPSMDVEEHVPPSMDVEEHVPPSMDIEHIEEEQDYFVCAKNGSIETPRRETKDENTPSPNEKVSMVRIQNES